MRLLLVLGLIVSPLSACGGWLQGENPDWNCECRVYLPSDSDYQDDELLERVDFPNDKGADEAVQEFEEETCPALCDEYEEAEDVEVECEAYCNQDYKLG